MKLIFVELIKVLYTKKMRTTSHSIAKPQAQKLSSFVVMALSCALLIPIFTACSHSPTTEKCQELDWYELGRQDGSKGHVNNSRREVKTLCEESDQSLSEALYNNGFDSGVSQYCTEENGFELGRSGKALSNICPSLMMEDFTKSYNSGQRYSEIKKLQSSVEAKINKIDSSLDNKRLALLRRGLLRGEKIQLENQKKSLDAEIEEISRR